MSTRSGKALFGVGLLVFGLAVSWIASAYLVARDQPKWLAAGVGALAFPVLPVVWHVIGERRRRKRLAEAKTPPKTTLAPGDRYLLRAFGVALLVLGPMFAIGKLGVMRGAWDNKLWFLPDDFDAIAGMDDVMKHVPSDADAVLIVREEKDNKAGVIAYADHQLAIIVPNDPKDTSNPADKVSEINAQRDKVPFVKIDTLSLVSLGKTTLAVATDRWKETIRVEGAGPRDAIKNELSKAPKDAKLTLAYVPAKPVDGLEKLSAWMTQKAVNEKISVEGQIVATDAASATKVLDAIRASWKTQRALLPEKCRDEVGKLTDGVELETKGATINFHVTIEAMQVMAAMMCGMKGSGLGPEIEAPADGE